jgi:hypothetical protein
LPDSQLISALLTRFQNAQAVRSNINGHISPASMVLSPAAANDATAANYGSADLALSDSQCRHWSVGLWAEAVHTPGLAGSAKAAVTFLVAIGSMNISEIILTAPQAAAAALSGGQLPAACQSVRMYTQHAGTPDQWMAFHVQTLNVSPVRQGQWAYHISQQSSQPEASTWVEGFRLNGYVAEVTATTPPGVNFLPVLERLAQDAYTKASAALP